MCPRPCGVTCSKRSKTGLWAEKDTPGGLLNFSYEDFDIKDKQKILFLELGDVYVPVCLNFWANNFWEQETILKNCLGIDSSQKLMDSHKNYFLILKALTFVSVDNPWLLGPPFQLMKTACR